MSVTTTKIREAFTPISTGVDCVVNDMKVFDQDQVTVYVGDTSEVAVRGTDYTIVIAVDFSGCTVTPLAPLTARASKLVVARLTPLTSDFAITRNGKVDEPRLTEQLDRNVMRLQEDVGKVDRSVRVPFDEAPIAELPDIAERAGKLLSFDEDGAPAVFSPVAPIGPVNKLSQVLTRTELAAIAAPDEGAAVFLAEANRQEVFVWTLGDFSTQVAADTAQGIYVKASTIAATMGAWVRRDADVWNAKWFGFLPSATAAANVTAFSAMMTVAVLGHAQIYVEAGSYNLNARILATTTYKLTLRFAPNAVLVWSNSSGGVQITYTDESNPPEIYNSDFRTSYVGGGTALGVIGPTGSPYVPYRGPVIFEPIYRGADTATQYWSDGVYVGNAWYPEVIRPNAQGKAGTFDMATGVIFADCQAPILSKPVFYHLATGVLCNGGTHGEGISFDGGELVGVRDGINMNLGAFKPGISMHDMHINASRYPIVLTNVGQVSIHDMSLYKTNGSAENWVGIKMVGCYGARIHHILGAHSGVTAGTGKLVTMEECDGNTLDHLFGEDWYGSGSLLEIGTGCSDNRIGDLQIGRSASGLVPVTFTGSPGLDNRFSGVDPVARTAFASGDTTPSVGNAVTGNFALDDVSTTSITMFDDGYPGQVINLSIGSANKTLVHSTNLLLKGGVNAAIPFATHNNVMVFRREIASNIWREEARTF